MRIILDENIPLPPADWINFHQVTTVQSEGFSGVKNGELLKLIDSCFDLFITADKNLRYQQNLLTRNIAILELPTNRLPILKLLKDEIIMAVQEVTGRDYKVLKS
ncbi:MAG: hypothetical protein SH807_08795 [Blastochloris sp.]|nr:hypothetical protein [Blastochloris sp.]